MTTAGLFYNPLITIQHRVYVFDGGTDDRGNPTGALAAPVDELVVTFFRMDWAAPAHDPISLDYLSRTITDVMMLVPDSSIYKKLDQVLLPVQLVANPADTDWLAYEVQNVPISWKAGFPLPRSGYGLADEVHVRRVQ
jgi:hypothetical protein